MKNVRIGASAALAIVLLGPAPAAWAQAAPPVARADLNGMLAWLAVRSSDGGPYRSDDWESSLLAAFGAGYHWNEHLKTEIDFGASAESSRHGARLVTIAGQTTHVFVESRFSQRTLAISQQYQFFRNQWFHPHVAAGAAVTWERITDLVGPTVLYDGRTSRVVDPGGRQGPRSERTVSPFVATGFKAYLTMRVFFRSDVRFAFRDDLDDVQVRLGFGFDFGGNN